MMNSLMNPQFALASPEGLISRVNFRDQAVQIHRQPAASRPEITVNHSEIVLKFEQSQPGLSPCKRN
jgi:hypothetical protein